MKKITSIVLALSLFLFSISPALADEEVRKLVVDLKAKGFSQSQWKENLESSDILFGPGDKFQVQIRVRNDGNRNQTHIKINQLLPPTVTASYGDFEINQLVPGEEYVKDITLTVKDKQYVYKNIKSYTYRVDAKTEVGTAAGDFTSFSTNNGTKVVAKSSTNSGLPATGSPIILGTLISGAIAAASLGLRKIARGY